MNHSPGSTVHVASLTSNQADVKVYAQYDVDSQPINYYWCCENDGACGTMHRDINPCVAEGVEHINISHQPPVKEEHHHGR